MEIQTSLSDAAGAQENAAAGGRKRFTLRMLAYTFMLCTLLAIASYGCTFFKLDSLFGSSEHSDPVVVSNDNEVIHLPTESSLDQPNATINRKTVISLDVNPEIMFQALMATSEKDSSQRFLLRHALGHLERQLDKPKRKMGKKSKKSSTNEPSSINDPIVEICDLAQLKEKELEKAYEELVDGQEVVVEVKASIAPFKDQKVELPISLDINELIVDKFADNVIYAGFQIPHPRFTGEVLDAEVKCEGKNKCEACVLIDTDPVGSASRRLEYNQELHQHQRRLIPPPLDTGELTEATNPRPTTQGELTEATNPRPTTQASTTSTDVTSTDTSTSTTTTAMTTTSTVSNKPLSWPVGLSLLHFSHRTCLHFQTTSTSSTTTTTSDILGDFVNECTSRNDCSPNQYKKECFQGRCYECSFANQTFTDTADLQCQRHNFGKPYCVAFQCCDTTNCQPDGCSILKFEYECCSDDECGRFERCSEIPAFTLLHTCVEVCFAPNAIVQSETRGTVMIQDLKVNERVLTASGAFKTVYTFQHYKPANGASSPYLKIQTVNQTEIVLTDRHMIFVEGQKYPIEASHVKVGDKLLWHGYKQETAGNSLAMNQAHNDAEPMEVASIDTVHVDGGFSPITEDGTIIVDGFAASCFSNPPKEASEYVELNFGNGLLTKVPFLHRSVYTHMLMSPIRLMCMYVTDIPCRIQEGQESRIAGDALWKDMYDLTVAWGLESIGLVLFAGLVYPFYLADLAIRHTLWSTFVLSMTASMFLPLILSRRKKPTNHY